MLKTIFYLNKLNKLITLTQKNKYVQLELIFFLHD